MVTEWHDLPRRTLTLLTDQSSANLKTHQPNVLNIFLHGSFSEDRAEVNGHGSRSSHRERRRHQDSDRATSQGSEGEEEITVRRSLKRKTARAAVNKIKLLEASDEDFEEEEEEKPRRSSSRLRHTVRASKRTAVILSSSDSDEKSSTRGRQMLFLIPLSYNPKF